MQMQHNRKHETMYIPELYIEKFAAPPIPYCAELKYAAHIHHMHDKTSL
jgi:hypothetical protein